MSGLNIDQVYVLMGPSDLSARIPGTHAMRQNILDTIDRANDRLFMAGYMLNSEEIFQRLMAKCETSRVIIHLDKKQTRKDENALAMSAKLTMAGAQVTLHESFEGSLHAKVIIADESEAIIGSANFTHSGSHRNLEAGLRLRGPSVPMLYRAITTMFELVSD